MHSEAEIEELCRLLLGIDRATLLAALRRLEHRASFTEHLSGSLGDALRLALARDPAFAESMGTMIAKGVHSTVQRDSMAFGRALAPAMGPAIRQSVWLMLQGLVQSIESVLDQRFSARSLRWRWEAWRTGRTFAEVAFVNTLLFRVEHVFLVHRSGGLELLHASTPGVFTQKPELIAAMLTAIQDFVRDAFAAPGEDTLTSFAVGELSVVVETGAHAALAAVVRGQSRPAIRLGLREAIERIELAMGPQLAGFSGNIDEFEAVRPHVETCLLQTERPGTDQRKKARPGLRIGLAAAVLLLVSWGLWSWWTYTVLAARVRDYVAALAAEPGLVVTGVEPRTPGWVVLGLQDPLARSPETLAAAQQLETTVGVAFQPFYSLHPTLVRRRVERALAPPTTVDFTLDAGQLVGRGEASHGWLQRSTLIATNLPGVDAVDFAAIVDVDERQWTAAAMALEARSYSLADAQQEGGPVRIELRELAKQLVTAGAGLGRSVAWSAKVQWTGSEQQGAAVASSLAAELSRALGLPVTGMVEGVGESPAESQVQFAVTTSR